MKVLLALCLTIAVSATAQTSGELQDQELAALRSELEAAVAEIEVLRAAVEEHEHEHEHDHVEIEDLETRVSVLEDGATPTTIENLQKRDAFHYQRIAALESDRDPTETIRACWDTGGTPDFVSLECACQAGSSWHDDDPATPENDRGCRWDTGQPADSEPEPLTVPSTPPAIASSRVEGRTLASRITQPAVALFRFVTRDGPPNEDVCEPIEPNYEADQCTWDFDQCDWDCL